MRESVRGSVWSVIPLEAAPASPYTIRLQESQRMISQPNNPAFFFQFLNWLLLDSGNRAKRERLILCFRRRWLRRQLPHPSPQQNHNSDLTP